MSEQTGASFNGKIAAIAMGLSAPILAFLTWGAPSMGPLILFVLGILSFGIWAFGDEMGTEKPLVRAGLVAFSMAVMGRVVAVLVGGFTPLPSALILYAIAASIAILLWSIAFLHRRDIPKTAGLAGAFAGLTPVVVFISGHVFVGVAVLAGSTSLLSIGAYPEEFGLREMAVVDTLLAAWGMAAAWLLLTGRIVRGG